MATTAIRSLKQRGWFWFYLPALVFLAAVVLYPILYMFRMSLNAYSLFDEVPKFVGLRNYIQTLSKGDFFHSFLVTTNFILFAIPLEMIFGFLIALLFYQGLKGFNILRSLIVTPIMMMSVVTGLAWRYIFHPSFGLIKYLASLIKVTPPMWFASPLTALFSIAIVDVWQQTPFSTLVFLAGLQSIPVSLIDAASIDGAPYRTIVRRIFLPALQRVFLLVLLLRIIDGYKLFDYVYVLTGGGPGNATVSMAYYTYTTAFQNMQIGYGSTLAVLTLVLSLLVGTFLIREIVRNA